MSKKLRKKLTTITNWLFITSQLAALIWVSLSYAFAGYATIALGQPYPIQELSKTAVEVLIGAMTLKVLSNIFEHNDGVVFGKTRKKTETDENESEGEG